MYHYPPAFLDEFGYGSVGHWSRNPSGRILVFVHGFGGQANETWNEMSHFVCGSEAFSQEDVVFLGYESRRSRAQVSAARVFELLDVLAENPSEIMSLSMGGMHLRGPEFKYSEFVLIGHSLGGAICRRVVLDAHLNGKQWATKLKVMLFSPAHLGADVIKLAQNALFAFSLGSILASAARFRNPVLQDLEPNSRFISDLQSDTDALIEQTGCPSLRANLVVHAEFENVVDTNRFGQDPVPVVFAGHDHISVCKVDHENQRPVDVIEEKL